MRYKKPAGAFICINIKNLIVNFKENLNFIFSDIGV